MGEKLKRINENKVDSVVISIAERFGKVDIPLKLRKMELIKDVGLPIPETDIFKRNQLKSLHETIVHRFRPEAPLIIRFAFNSNRIGMPAFYVRKEKDITGCIENVKMMLERYPDVDSIILQNATHEKEAENKISGRLMFYENSKTSVEQVMELYKGALSTGILNNVDVSSPRYARFVKRYGEMMKPERRIDKNSPLTQSEIKDIAEKLQEYKEGIDFAKNIFLAETQKRNLNASVSFEFFYKNGKIIFTDID